MIKKFIKSLFKKNEARQLKAKIQKLNKELENSGIFPLKR